MLSIKTRNLEKLKYRNFGIRGKWTSSIISSSIDFDYSFNSQVNSAGQDNINNDDHNSIDFDIHDNLHVNNDSVIVESNVNKFCADNLNAPFKSDSESSISNQTPDKNTGTSSKRTPKHLKRKRKSFVDPLRRQKKLNKSPIESVTSINNTNELLIVMFLRF